MQKLQKTIFVSLVLLLVVIFINSGFPFSVNNCLLANAAVGKELRLLDHAFDRVMVIAPHPDDEILGAGGLIYDTLQRNRPVRVVVLTNGDAFRVAAARYYETSKLSPAMYIHFGKMRQQETLAAAAVVGLSPEAVTFLGYPDRGLSAMWIDYWLAGTRYTSPYTDSSKSPYPNSFRLQAPYNGESAVGDLEKLILNFKPRQIIVSDPHDIHPDHWATNVMVRYALENLKTRGNDWVKGIKIYSYLVHRGNWPEQGLNLDQALKPPSQLALVYPDWLKLDLPMSTREKKLAALDQYVTQNVIMGNRMVGFIRANELFRVFPAIRVPTITPDNRRQELEAAPPAVLDPLGDSKPSRQEASADLNRAVLVSIGSDYLLKVVYRKAFNPEVTTVARLYFLPTRDEPQRRDLIITADRDGFRLEDRSRHETKKILTRVDGRSLELLLPGLTLGQRRQAFLAIFTYYQGSLIDRTAWQLLELAAQP